MKQDISFFLPVRKGSQRVENKNTRPFSNVSGGLLEIKLKQLLECDFCKEIVLSTNDEKSIEIANTLNYLNKIRIERRPEHLCQSNTLVQDLIRYVPKVMQTDHIFWVHATSPFVDANDYFQAVSQYYDALDCDYDSLMSVTKHHFFMWDALEKKIANTDDTKGLWPNTQDLDPIYEINHAFYISSKKNYQKFQNRIGINPKLYELEKIKNIDIDWEDDFLIAEILYSRLCTQFK